jgi:hypothetical protein
MYCSQIASAPLPRELLESVFRYAADVTEGGKTYGQRRTGVNRPRFFSHVPPLPFCASVPLLHGNASPQAPSPPHAS